MIRYFSLNFRQMNRLLDDYRRIFKGILPSQLMEQDELSRILYTGTGKNYFLNQLRDEKRFSHLIGSIYFSQLPTSAMGYAIKRSKFYGDTPLVLVVDKNKIQTEQLHDKKEQTVKYLNLDNFFPYDFISTPNQENYDTYYWEIIDLSKKIMKMTEDRVAKANNKYLSEAF